MNKPHVHAEFIKAKADGATIQERHSVGYDWRDMSPTDFTFFNAYEYRILPEKEYPETSLKESDLERLWEDLTQDQGFDYAYTLLANAVIKQHILDTENK